MEQDSCALTLVSKDHKDYPVPLTVALQARQLRELLNSDCAEAESRTFEFKNFDSKAIQNLAQIMWFIEQNKAMKKKCLLIATAQKFCGWSIDEICAAWKAGDLLEFPYMNEFVVECFAQKLNMQRQQVTILRVSRACRVQIPSNKSEPLIDAIQKRVTELENASKNFSRPPAARKSLVAPVQNPQPANDPGLIPGQVPQFQGALRIQDDEESKFHLHLGGWPGPCTIM